VYGSSDRQPPANPALRYLAILRAARDFGVSAAEIERVAQRFNPLDFEPGDLAEALADTLAKAA
jgi:hypothetical protein